LFDEKNYYYIVYYAKTAASTHSHTITKDTKTHKIEEHPRAAKTIQNYFFKLQKQI